MSDDFNRRANIGQGYLCLREENLGFYKWNYLGTVNFKEELSNKSCQYRCYPWGLTVHQ